MQTNYSLLIAAIDYVKICDNLCARDGVLCTCSLLVLKHILEYL